jgi:medium-chain acyl-[acyl-carrier-protein] hydrolase
MFCLPYAGAGAHIYRRWPELLPQAVAVCTVHLPGRESRLSESPYRQLTPLVEDLGEAILPYLDSPYVLFGHSLGALIIYELARFLQREHGPEPAHLFASGCSAPQIVRSKKTYNLPESEFLESVFELNGTPREVIENAELMHALMPVLRADFELAQTYSHLPGPPLASPVTAYGGLQDSHVSRESLESWQQVTTSAFTMRMFEGDHFFLHTSQALMLELLSSSLQQYLRQQRPAASLTPASVLI